VRFFAALLAIVFSTPVLAIGSPDEVAQREIWEADFSELEGCVEGLALDHDIQSCVGLLTEKCTSHNVDESRAAAMECHEYERDMWQLAYTRALGRAMGRFSLLDPSSYLSTKTRRDEAMVFVENETLWLHASEAECDFYLNETASMAGGFQSLLCMNSKYAVHIIYLNSLDFLGIR